jgi:hypothetical protein
MCQVAPVTIPLVSLASYDLLSDPADESKGRLHAAFPRNVALDLDAKLVLLRSVDIEEAYDFAVHLDRVAVDHRGSAGDGIGARGGR